MIKLDPEERIKRSRESKANWLKRNPTYHKDYKKFKRTSLNNRSINNKELELKKKLYDYGIIPSKRIADFEEYKIKEAIKDMKKVFCWDEVCVIL